jgi:hypothetical protein
MAVGHVHRLGLRHALHARFGFPQALISGHRSKGAVFVPPQARLATRATSRRIQKLAPAPAVLTCERNA